MQFAARASVRFLALVTSGCGLTTAASAQTPGPALAAPHPTYGPPGIIRFSQAGGLPYGLPTGGPHSPQPSGGGSLIPGPLSSSPGNGGAVFWNNPGRPFLNRRIVLNPPIPNRLLLAQRVAPNNGPNLVAVNGAFNPGTLNPVVVLPAPGAILAPQAPMILAAGFGPRVNPWYPPGPAVEFASPGASSTFSDRSPGADPAAPEVYYDPSTRTFVSPQPSGVTRPSTTGFLPWIWE